jgi:hypothetical protein
MIPFSMAQFAPTATEIFELRTKCQAMADEIAAPFIRHQRGDQSIGVIMTMPDGYSYYYDAPSIKTENSGPKYSIKAESNLSTKTLYCYALITLSELSLSNPSKREEYIHLFDAQTKTKLAYVIENEFTRINGFSSSIIDPFYRKPPILNSLEKKNKEKRLEEVMKYISEKMDSNR